MYFVAGSTEDGQHQVRVVPESELEATKAKLALLTSVHVYALTPGSQALKDSAVLATMDKALTEPGFVANGAGSAFGDHRYAAIGPLKGAAGAPVKASTTTAAGSTSGSNDIKGGLDRTSSMSSVQLRFKKEEEARQKRIEAGEQPLSGPFGGTKKKAKKAAGGGGIKSMFAKGAKMKKEDKNDDKKTMDDMPDVDDVFGAESDDEEEEMDDGGMEPDDLWNPPVDDSAPKASSNSNVSELKNPYDDGDEDATDKRRPVNRRRLVDSDDEDSENEEELSGGFTKPSPVVGKKRGAEEAVSKEIDGSRGEDKAEDLGESRPKKARTSSGGRKKKESGGRSGNVMALFAAKATDLSSKEASSETSGASDSGGVSVGSDGKKVRKVKKTVERTDEEGFTVYEEIEVEEPVSDSEDTASVKGAEGAASGGEEKGKAESKENKSGSPLKSRTEEALKVKKSPSKKAKASSTQKGIASFFKK